MPDQPVLDEFDPAQWVWGSDASAPRLLHTMIRVSDFEASQRFYIDLLGMKLLDRFDVASREVTALFLGFGDYAAGGVIELTRKWNASGPHSHGSGYGHVAIGVPDVEATIARLEAAGVEVATAPVIPMPGGPMIAFVKDPDGYMIELVQTRR